MSRITNDQIVADNGDGYNPSDNRTYCDEPLSLDPVEDILLHVAISKPGSVAGSTLRGSFLGKIDTESRKQAELKVFHFPKASNLGATLIKKENHVSLYPISLISRYSKEDTSVDVVSLNTALPIYFKNKEEFFFIPFDEQFLSDLKLSTFFNKKHSNIKILKDNKTKSDILCIYADSLDELRSEMDTNYEDSAISVLTQAYRSYFMNLENAEKVIVIEFSTEIKRSDNLLVMELEDLLFRQSVSFNFFKGAKVDDTYYLIDEDNVIHEDKTVTVRDNFFGSIKNFDPKNTVIVPYSEEDWNKINFIHNRFNELCDEISSFFKSSKTDTGLLDHPLKEHSTPFLKN